MKQFVFFLIRPHLPALVVRQCMPNVFPCLLCRLRHTKENKRLTHLTELLVPWYPDSNPEKRLTWHNLGYPRCLAWALLGRLQGVSKFQNLRRFYGVSFARTQLPNCQTWGKKRRMNQIMKSHAKPGTFSGNLGPESPHKN